MIEWQAGMGKQVEARLQEGFDAAESRGECFRPCSRADRAAIRRRLGASFVSPIRGAYARLAYWKALDPRARHLHLMRTLQSGHPAWVFGAFSAAVAHGLSVSYALLDSVWVVSWQTSRNMPGVRYMHGDPACCVRRMGLRVTPLASAVFDSLARAPFAEGLAIADSALRLPGPSAASVRRDVASVARCHRGAQHALRTMRHADARAESGGESIARAVMIEHGFDVPELQVELGDPVERRRMFRVDFFWRLPEGRCVIGEFDGAGKYAGEKPGRRNAPRTGPLGALLAERRREARLTAYGFPVMRFGYDELRNPERLVALLEAYGIPRRT